MRELVQADAGAGDEADEGEAERRRALRPAELAEHAEQPEPWPEQHRQPAWPQAAQAWFGRGPVGAGSSAKASRQLPLTVICWSTLAEDNAARAFSVGFYESIHTMLRQERLQHVGPLAVQPRSAT